MKTKREKRKRNNSKLQKQQRAEHKNKYLNRFKSVFSLVGCTQMYNLIPREELDRIYSHRVHAFKFIAAEGEEIPANVLSELRIHCNDNLRETKIRITNDGNVMSLFEFFTIGIIFFDYISSLKENEFKNALVVKEINKRFREYKVLLEEANNKFEVISDNECFFISDMTLKLYWVVHEFNVDKANPNGIENLVIVHCTIPEKIYDNKDNNYRPAVRICLGLSQRGIGFFQFNPEETNISFTNKDSGIGIFIQAHALQRLKERLDCLNPLYYNMCLINSLMDSKILKEEKDFYLIAYNIYEFKIGYLLAELSQNKLIIRTFLFITQNGTPEGKKLADHYGLCKLDKTYLELDKLSTFVANDMCSDTKLSDIFQQVGCQYLLDLSVDNRIKKVCDAKSKSISVAEIAKYLRLNENKYYSNNRMPA